MRKSSKNNRSALMIAGENSLNGIDQRQQDLNSKYLSPTNEIRYNQSRNNQERGNEILHESQVHQLYKRPEYQQSPQYQYSTQYLKQKGNKDNSNNGKNKVSFDMMQQQQSLSKYFSQEQMPYTQNLPIQSKQHLLQPYNSSSPKFSPIKSQPQDNKNSKKPLHYYKADPQRIKKLMMKLTLTRLRKMQALVRGFLVRRKVYPELLEQYLIAKSVLSLVEANVVYRQISTIIMQTITFPKYNDHQQVHQLYKGRQKVLQDLVYDSIVSRVLKKQLQSIVQQSLIQRGLLLNRPQITFGFNLRDPLELLLYERLIQAMNQQLKRVCTEAINEQALDRRELFIIDEWIQKFQLIKPLYEEIANELLEENVGEYVVDSILQKVVKEGVGVIVETVYNKQANEFYFTALQQIKQNLQQTLLQQAFIQAVTELNYGLQSPPSKDLGLK